jgi:hypothetical protein
VDWATEVSRADAALVGPGFHYVFVLTSGTCPASPHARRLCRGGVPSHRQQEPVDCIRCQRMDLEARIRPNVYQWIRLPLDGARPPLDWRPAEFAVLKPMRLRRGIDVKLDYCKSYSWARIFSRRRCRVDCRPFVVQGHLEGSDVGHESCTSFGGCLATRRQSTGRGEHLPPLVHKVVSARPLSSLRALSQYWRNIFVVTDTFQTKSNLRSSGECRIAKKALSWKIIRLQSHAKKS